MANGLWVGSVSDSITRRAVSAARITVTDPATGDLIGLYRDRAGTQPLGNPFLTREDGKVKFYARAGRVSISAFKGGTASVFENEIIVDDWGAAPGCACGTMYGEFSSFYFCYTPTFSTFGGGAGTVIFFMTAAGQTTSEVYPRRISDGQRWPGTCIKLTAPADSNDNDRIVGFYAWPQSESNDDHELVDADGVQVAIDMAQLTYGYYWSAGFDCIVESVDIVYATPANPSVIASAPTSCDKSFGVACYFPLSAEMTVTDPETEGFVIRSSGFVWDYTSSNFSASSQRLQITDVAVGTVIAGVIALRTAPWTCSLDPAAEAFALTSGAITEAGAYGFDSATSTGSLTPSAFSSAAQILRIEFGTDEGAYFCRVLVAGTGWADGMALSIAEHVCNVSSSGAVYVTYDGSVTDVATQYLFWVPDTTYLALADVGGLFTVYLTPPPLA